jgi:site-specific recombinase XerD
MFQRRKRKGVPIETFCRALQADGKSPATVKWSRQRLGQFRQWLEGEGRRFDRLEREQLDAYAAGLYARGLSAHTVYGHKKLLRQFLKWCEERGHLRTNPAAGWKVRRPRPPDPEEKSVRLEDVLKLLEAARRSMPPRHVRDEAIVRLLFSTGLRAGEVIELRLRDVRGGTVFVRRAKGGKHRRVYPGPGDVQAVQRWLEVRPGSDDDHVFLCSSGQGWHACSYWGLRETIRRLAVRASVKVSAHGFRHGFAIQYLDEGGNLSTLSDLLGHSDIAVTKLYYGSYETDRLARAARRFSPGKALDRLLEAETLRQMLLPLGQADQGTLEANQRTPSPLVGSAEMSADDGNGSY